MVTLRMERVSMVLRGLSRMLKSPASTVGVSQTLSTLAAIGLAFVAWQQWLGVGAVVLAVPVSLLVHLFFFRRAEERGDVAEYEEWVRHNQAIYHRWSRVRRAAAVVIVLALLALLAYVRVIWDTDNIE